MDPQLRSQYKDSRKDSGGHGPKVQQKSRTDQRIGGRSSNLLPETYDDAAVVGLTANGAGTRLFLYIGSSFSLSLFYKTMNSYNTAVWRAAKM